MKNRPPLLRYIEFETDGPPTISLPSVELPLLFPGAPDDPPDGELVAQFLRKITPLLPENYLVALMRACEVALEDRQNADENGPSLAQVQRYVLPFCGNPANQ